MMPHTIFFMGKPGSGKGVQARLLSEKTGWPVVGTSEGLRALADIDSTFGKKLRDSMDAGILTPSWFPMYVFTKAVAELNESDSIIFDGFNRMPVEAEGISEILEWVGRPFTVFYLKVSDEEVHRRLALRKDREGRADDSVVDARVRMYYEYTEPSIELYRKARVLVEINGEQTPEEIAADIRAKLAIQ